ncbi:nucleoside-diphosphate-sugar pyrophosphorylase [Sesbania bispinosa]|nr:nucleoside-diphosphate-sugar pyrophosphorylase [Sesbania bispinosa]
MISTNPPIVKASSTESLPGNLFANCRVSGSVHAISRTPIDDTTIGQGSSFSRQWQEAVCADATLSGACSSFMVAARSALSPKKERKLHRLEPPSEISLPAITSPEALMPSI